VTAPPARAQRRWWRPPSLRTLEHGHEERHASWLELFFDLVLVVAISQLAHVFVHHPGGHGALVAGGLFCTVFLAWQGFMAYADRFDTDDLIFRVATFAQMLLLLVLAQQVPQAAEGHHVVFAAAFALYRAILVAEYLRAWRHAPVARPLIRRYAGVYAVSVALWAVSTALPWPTAMGLWVAAVLLDLSAPPLATRLHTLVPTDPSHLPERFGLFTLIVLGELVVSVSAGSLATAWTAQRTATAVAGFVVAVCLWWLYFERLSGRSLPRRAVPIVTFSYAHLPLLAALMFVAAGVAVLVGEPEQAGAGRWALGAGVAVFLLGLDVMQRQLDGGTDRRITLARGVAAVLALVSAGAAGVGLAATLPAAALLMALVAVESALCRQN
jgi:low temperature requirement protein LtrA